MAKLTRAQQRELRSIQHGLQLAYDYLNKPTTIVAAQKGAATTTVDFLLPDGRVACEVQKFIGSYLVQLPGSIRELEKFLEANA